MARRRGCVVLGVMNGMARLYDSYFGQREQRDEEEADDGDFLSRRGCRGLSRSESNDGAEARVTVNSDKEDG